jgi:hypothetical protein
MPGWQRPLRFAQKARLKKRLMARAWPADLKLL